MTPPAAQTKLLIATRNDGKIREIRDLFTGLPFELKFPVEQFLERLPDEADLERGTSFAENAVAKARYFAKRATIPTLAEDSGLEVDALDGAPGVFSARWAEMHGAVPTSSARRATVASWRISIRRSRNRSWSKPRAMGGSCPSRAAAAASATIRCSCRPTWG